MKTTAVIMILASSLLTALTVIQREKAHCDTLIKTVNFLIAVKNRAMFYAEPFRDIVSCIFLADSRQSLDFVSSFLSDDSISAPDSWTKAVNSSKCPLNKTELELIIEFGCGLCSCSREQIEEHCGKIISELHERTVSLKENMEKKVKLTSALSLSLGIAAVLIFI